MATKEDQGQVMGMVGSVQALATVIVMALGGYIHALNINITIIGGGMLMTLSSLLFVSLFLNKNKKARSKTILNQN